MFPRHSIINSQSSFEMISDGLKVIIFPSIKCYSLVKIGVHDLFSLFNCFSPDASVFYKIYTQMKSFAYEVSSQWKFLLKFLQFTQKIIVQDICILGQLVVFQKINQGKAFGSTKWIFLMRNIPDRAMR